MGWRMRVERVGNTKKGRNKSNNGEDGPCGPVEDAWGFINKGSRICII
jgi:hypothetical protein